MIIAWVAALLAVTSAGVATPRFGPAFVHADSTACVTMAGNRLTAGQRLLVAIPDPPRVIEARIVGPQPEACLESRGDVADTALTYVARLRPHGPCEPAVGIAVLAPGATGAVARDLATVRVPGVPEAYTFRVCASNEGIHLTAWRGTRRVWHQYHYVGYNLEPTCTDDEVGE